jgi:asparagine synthase (glutamine-hydrolysing)
MCGIAGVISYGKHFRLDEQGLHAMAEPMRYRGPDQEGFLHLDVNNVYLSLAHKRLSIIDLSDAGRQPMYSTSGQTVIVFNGEIYNYSALKKELLQLGCYFRSHSDTEVILQAYEMWGIEDTLHKLDGMFAFALYDIAKNIFFLARDRFGKKPLYYHVNDTFLAFSSDIRSFYHLPVSFAIDPYALGYFFAELSTPKEQSVWKEISKLPSASFLSYGDGKNSIKYYWHLDYKNKTSDKLSEVTDKCELLLEAGIKKRLVADVPVGTFLSGGIDSSLVTLMAARNYDQKLNTFSVGFDYEHYNELPYARQVATLAGTDHHEITVNPLDAAVFDRLIEEYGEPFADSSMIPSYFVSKFAANHVKVVLGGDGGDEFFGGYRTYNQGLRMHHWQKLKSLGFLLNLVPGMISAEKKAYLQGIFQNDEQVISSALYRNMGFNSNELQQLSNNEVFNSASEKEYLRAIRESGKYCNNIFDTILYGSIHTRLVNDYFVKVDRASMYASLEVRTPFVDRALVEYVATLPPDKLMYKGVNKYITKKIAGKYFSQEFIHRPKMGFGIPIGEWIRKELKDYFYEHIICNHQTMFETDQKYVKKVYDEHMSGKADNKDKLWLIFVLNRWAALLPDNLQ